MSKGDNKYRCRNCNGHYYQNDNFCPECGQKVEGFKLKFSSFLKESINTIFNLENKLIRTIIRLFIPAQLTIDFFNGIRKKYYHPFRIYFVSILLLFFAISIQDKAPPQESDGESEDIISMTPQMNQKQKEEANSLDLSGLDLDSFESDNPKIFLEKNSADSVPEIQDSIDNVSRSFSARFLKKNRVKRFGNSLAGKSDYDYREVVIQKRYIADQIQKFAEDSSNSSSLVDALYESLFFVIDGDTTSLSDTSQLEKVRMDLIKTSVELTFQEQFYTDIDSVVRSKKLDSWMDRLYLQRQLFLTRNDFNQEIYANLTWLFLALVPVHALILLLFFYRRRKYYIEHFVFLLELYSATLLFTTAMLIGLTPFLNLNKLLLPGILFTSIFTLLSLRAFYGQSWVVTIIKSLFISLLFFLTAIIVFLAFLVLVAIFSN